MSIKAKLLQKLLVSLLALACGDFQLHPAILHVPDDQPTIQAALDAAKPGDQIEVRPGFYRENPDFKGKDVRLLGLGGAAATVLDGGGKEGVHVGPNGLVAGFTITNAFGTFGGGIIVSGVGSVIRSNIFDHCNQGSGGFGAAIGGNSASPLIEANLFTRCSADSQFLSGVLGFVNGSSPVIRNNLFLSNDAVAINLTLPAGNKPQVINNTFVGNRVAIHLDNRVNVDGQIYRNNILAGNQVGLEVVFGNGQIQAAWDNNLLFGNFSDYTGVADLTGTAGNFHADPWFYDPEVGDFRLRRNSPAIDSGSAVGMPLNDFDGNPRPLDGNGDGSNDPDRGAFEYVVAPPQPPSRLTATSTVEGVGLDWRAVPDAGGYVIRRGPTAAGPFETISEINEDRTTFEDRTGVVGSFYFYVVAAFDGLGTGADSMPVGARAGNRPPIANHDQFELLEDTTAEFAPLANDTDPDGDALVLLSVSHPPNASVFLKPGGVIAVTPSPNFAGTNVLTYVISDGHGATSSGTVTLVVIPVHDSPVARAGFAQVSAENEAALKLSASSVETTNLTYAVTRPPSVGVIRKLDTQTGQLVYLAPRFYSGLDSFEFTVSDGIANSIPAVFTVQVVAPADTDADGIPDFWEQRYDINNPGDDRDHDGFTNLQEYYADTDPREGSSYLRILDLRFDDSGNPVIRWASVGGVRYRIQTSDEESQGFLDLIRPAAAELDAHPLGVATTNTFTDLSGGLQRPWRLYRVKVFGAP